jgi:hypothetical protein
MKNLIQNRILPSLKVIKDLQILLKLQILISTIAFSILSWRLAGALKISLFDYLGTKLYAWTKVFYHPHESTLLNYLLLCIATGLYSLFIYIFTNNNKYEIIKNEFGWIRKKIFIRILIGSAILLILAVKFFTTYRTLTLCLIALMPAFYFLGLNLKAKAKLKAIADLISALVSFENRKNSIREITFALLGFLLLIVSLEPLNILKSTNPVYLVNECDVYSNTILDSGIINNKIFLNNLEDSDIEAADVKNIPLPSGANFMMPPTREVKFYSILDNLRTLMVDLSGRAVNSDIALESDQEADNKQIRSFINKNFLENIFYNMSRGQINHIGHVLNPINEYMMGKSYNEIYFQYGLGNTFIMKWTMELFGGISIDNYYKCYLFYLIYFITFLLMLFVLFDDIGYILCCFAIVTFAFFYQGYIGFIIAPGIIPTIHMFDTIVIISLLLFFRQNRLIYLLSAILFTVLGIIINQQFGLFLVASLIVSLLVFLYENKDDALTKKGWLLGILFTVIVSMSVYQLVSTNAAGDTFTYFLTGLFSWPAHRKIIMLTICYLAISYLFMFMLKNSRHYLKYIYLMIFVYTQGLFVYYYWAGLANHLPTVIPFVGVQLSLMFYMVQKNIITNGKIALKLMSFGKGFVIFILLLLIAQNATIFYRQKTLFLNNFVAHETYQWNYDRARLITTINPEPINEGIFMIRKYSSDSRGIYIISQYDNLLPFLSERYSLMPYFEMTWHLFSDKEVNDAIDRIRKSRPQYIFVDINIDQENIIDPWAKIYNSDGAKRERASRIGRYSELQKIFKAISPDYELIKKGDLISVYKRIL